MVVDQNTDPVMAHLMRRIDGRTKLAEALSEVNVDVAELAELPDDAFAWPEKRAFPIHDPGHALMSCVYREGQDVPAHVDATLKEACDMYGIDVSILERVKTASHSEAHDNSDEYLLPDLKRLRVTSAGQVKHAEERLRTEGQRLSLEHRATASARLVQKAAEYNMPLRAETLKMAGMVATDTRVLADWLEARGEAAPDNRDGYEKMAATVRRLPHELRDRAQQMKLADAIYDLDKLSNLQGHWNRRLPDPMASVFNTDKVASHGVNLAGKFVPMARLASYDSNFYSDILGPDIVREASDAAGRMDASKLAEVLDTLPYDMKQMLSQYIR